MHRLIVAFLAVTTLAGPGLAPRLEAASDVHGRVRVGDKPAANVVIWIDVPGAPKVAAGDGRPVLDQRNLQFAPKVMAVQVGTAVDFPNNDRVFHNVFSFHDGKRFDLGMYPTGTSKRITFERAGVSHLFCNIHPHMAAYVVVVDSPYFAVSDDAGGFTIRGLPAGTFTYRMWRAGAAVATGSVTVKPGTPWEVQW